MPVSRLAWAAAACSIIAAPQALSATYDFTAIAVTGMSAPGTGATVANVTDPTINASGDVAFRAGLTGAGVFDSNNEALFKHVGGTLQKVIREGEAIPGAGGVYAGSAGSPIIADDGDIAFLGFVGGAPGLYSESGGTFERVVQAGDAAPGTAGTFLGFGQFSQSGNGDIAFGALVSGIPNFGAFTNRSGNLEPIVLSGETAPGTGLTLNATGILTQNSSGDTAFKGVMTGAVVGLFAERGGNLELVARSGDVDPVTGGVFRNFGTPNSGQSINDAGNTAFVGELQIDAGTGINAGNDTAIYRENGLSFDLIVQEGGTAADTGGTFAVFGNPTLNNNGDLAFLANLNLDAGLGITSANDGGIFALVDGVLKLVIREGDTLDIGGGVFRTISSFNVFNSFAQFNDAGDIAFKAFFTDGSQGVFRASLSDDAVTAVPVPPALGFFLSALASLGFATWRRDKTI